MEVNEADLGNERFTNRARWVLPLVVLLFGLIATALATHFLRDNIRVKDSNNFTQAILQIEDAFRARMDAYISLLRGGAGLFAANGFVDRVQFRNFYEQLQIEKHYPGVQGFGYTARFPADKLEAITAMALQQGLTNFQVWPPEPRQEYHAIIFLEPPDDRNRQAFGYDMYTDGVRREAMRRARDTGDAVASGKVVLVQELPNTPKQNGFLIYLPIYVDGDVPSTVAERREKLQGFIYSPFRAGDLFRAILNGWLPKGLQIRIHDGAAPTEENLIFTTEPVRTSGAVLEQVRPVSLGQRTWTIVYSAYPEFSSDPAERLLYFVPILGVIGSLLLALFTAAEARARRRSEVTARNFLSQRQWLEITLSSIGDGVITTDEQCRVRFLNPVAEQLTGWKSSEAAGRPLNEIFDIINEETRQVVESPAVRVIKEGQAVNLPNHTLLIRKDGTERCIDDSAAPIRARDGSLIGVVLVFRETTERRRYERRITAQHAVTGILADSPAIEIAAGRLLESICEHLNFEHGVFWMFDEQAGTGTALKIWHLPNVPFEGFDQACLAFRPSPGEGLPGTVWETGKVLWVGDFSSETEFPRAEAARKYQIRAALALPIQSDSSRFGALEFFSREIEEPDVELQHILRGIGHQIGLFIERKRAEHALRESEELHRAISETAADGIMTINEESVIQTVNTAVEQIFGYSRDELIGQSLSILMPERMRAGHFAGIRRFLSTGQKRINWTGVELPGLRKDGREIPLEISFGVSMREGKHLFTALLRDISLRKQAEQRLREAEERFSLLVRQVEEYAITLIDRDGCISEWNAGAERIFGYTAEEILGRHVRILYVPEDAEQGIPEKELMAAEKDGQALDERWHLRKDGGRFWASGSTNSLEAEDGTLRGFSKILRDMTARKKTEEAIRELNQELELRVQRRTAALQESKEQMEAFSYTVAHDLRAPLRAMQGFSHALSDDYGEQLDQAARDYLARIMSSASRMDELIQDLLSYSQLSRSDLPFSRVPLPDFIRAAVDQYAPEIDRHQAIVEQTVADVAVLAHPATLKHAVGNLISNALKFARPDERPHIRIRVIEKGESVQVSVQDNGIGVAPEHHDRIFRVFERLHAAEEFPGTGIGLAIVKKGVERMNGSVGLASEMGQGSLFWIELPKAP